MLAFSGSEYNNLQQPCVGSYVARGKFGEVENSGQVDLYWSCPHKSSELYKRVSVVGECVKSTTVKVIFAFIAGMTAMYGFSCNGSCQKASEPNTGANFTKCCEEASLARVCLPGCGLRP